MDVGLLRELRLVAADGSERRLGDFFESRRVVLVFLRHFG